MYCPIGFALQIIGCLLMIGLLSWFAIDRLQSKTKLWYLLIFPILTIIFVCLTQIPNREVKILFSWLSLLFPVLVLLFFGGLLLILAIFQGFNSISSTVFCLVLSSMLAVTGSILLILCSKKSA